MSDQELTEALNRTQGIVLKHIGELEAEVARAERVSDFKDKAIAELRAENTALREALSTTHDWLLSDSIFTDTSQIHYHREIVRAALEGEE